MKKAALAVLALMGSAVFAPASAQSISLYCGGSNLCILDATGYTYDTIAWSFDKNGTDALIDYNCTNLGQCEFHCPTRPGGIDVTVRLVSNQTIVASATSQAACTREPL